MSTGCQLIRRQIAVLNRFNTIHKKMYNHLIRKVWNICMPFQWMRFTLRKAVKLFPIGACTFKRKLKVLYPWVASAEVWFKLLYYTEKLLVGRSLFCKVTANRTIWNACTIKTGKNPSDRVCGKNKKVAQELLCKCQWCSNHILTSSVIYYWTDTWQHGIYLFYTIR